MGGFVQAVHFFCNPETRSTILLDREAKRRRKTGEDPNIYGPNEIRGGHKISPKECATIFWRYVTRLDFGKHKSDITQTILYVLHRAHRPLALPPQRLQRRPDLHVPRRFQAGLRTMGLRHHPTRSCFHTNPDRLLPRIRFVYALNHPLPAQAQTEPWFRCARGEAVVAALPRTAGVSRHDGLRMDKSGARVRDPMDRTDDIHGACRHRKRKHPPLCIPPSNPIANQHQYAIYQSSIDYQTAAYGPYAASATGGNDLARDFMAGVAALYATPLYKNIPGRPVQYASTLLSCLAVLVTIPIYVVYWKGPEIRAKSRFAQSLDKTREERTEKRRKSSLAGVKGEKQGREHLERV